MADEHLSIGEVLTLLQDEFPDVTISKIRFLESQGLVDPERTPSGYRKFFSDDIDRLRWILVQQRENFLPLKVIKDRLESAEGVPSDDEPAPSPSSESTDSTSPPSPATDSTTPSPETTTLPIWMADVAANRSLDSRASDPLLAGNGSRSGAGRGASDVSMTAPELAGAAGVTLEALRGLEQFGLIVGHPYGDDTYYDGDALLIATRSAGFLAHGIGARHLRMFKVAAEREAGFLEQVAMPLLKQRNPDSRRQAVELVEELAGLGQDLRTALLRANLRQHLDRG